MKKKELETCICDLQKFGMIFLGDLEDAEIIGYDKSAKRYHQLRKEVENRYPGKTLAYDIKSGNCWIV